jgi:HSP20 family molecular chaperone IbpA
MSDYLRIHLEQLERRLRALAAEVTRVQVTPFRAEPCWTPAINVYRCTDRFVVCVDLAGVSASDLSVQAEPHRLRFSGQRAWPVPPPPACGPMQVLVMEVDCGRFQRELALPEPIDPDRATAEQRVGWLWIHLPLKSAQ